MNVTNFPEMYTFSVSEMFTFMTCGDEMERLRRGMGEFEAESVIRGDMYSFREPVLPRPVAWGLLLNTETYNQTQYNTRIQYQHLVYMNDEIPTVIN